MQIKLGTVKAEDYSSKIHDYCPSCKEAKLKESNKAKEEKEKQRKEEKERRERFRRGGHRRSRDSVPRY